VISENNKIKILGKSLAWLKENVVLVFILVFSLAVRLWGISFGLPHVDARPDELMIVGAALRVWQGNFNPHFFIYPHLFFYALSLLYGIYFIVLLISGSVASYGDFLTKTLIDRTGIVLIDRVFVAVLGALTVLALYILVQKVFKSKQLALLSAGFLSIAYLHVRDSHFGVTDVPLTFMIILAYIFIFMIYERGSKQDYILAGIFSGLASGTKYNALLLAASILIAHLLRVKNARAVLDKNFIFSSISMFAAFILTTPFFIFDLPTAWYDFSRHVFPLHSVSIPAFGLGWIYHLRLTLLYGLGFMFLLFGLIGMALLFRRYPRRAFILFCFPLLYYFFAGFGRHYYLVRYMVPVIPFLCLSAAYAAERLSDFLSRFYQRKTAILLAIVFLITFFSMKNTFYFDRVLSKRDTRSIAYSWIINNISEGATIGLWTSFWGVPTEIESVPSLIGRNETLKKWGAKSIMLVNDMYIDVRMRQEGFIGYHVFPFDYQRISDGSGLPEYIFVEVFPIGNPPPPFALRRILEREYQQIAFFSADITNIDKLKYDPQDAFYVPYSGARFVGRPGPNLFIFKRKSG
jgi:4-amino-4-deoxy-L-arabinose transferase-like glycosyltransferase